MNLFQFEDYKAFLRETLSSASTPGAKSRFAEAIRCQPSFLSQVLNGKPDLSLEQSLRATKFLGFNEEETEYFLLLVQKAKASDHALVEYFASQIRSRLEARGQIQNRVKASPGLTLEEQAKYYSSWLYSGIHILAALPDTRTREQLKKRLRVPPEEIDQAVDFLLSTGILTQSAGQLALGTTRIHLPTDSPLLPHHHANWRRKALESCEFPKKKDLHYSLVMGLSEADVQKVRELILELISKTETILKDSKEKKPVAFLVDYFEY